MRIVRKGDRYLPKDSGEHLIFTIDGKKFPAVVCWSYEDCCTDCVLRDKHSSFGKSECDLWADCTGFVFVSIEEDLL